MLPFIVRQQFKGPDAFGPALAQPVGNTEAEQMIASLSAGEVYGREGGGWVKGVGWVGLCWWWIF